MKVFLPVSALVFLVLGGLAYHGLQVDHTRITQHVIEQNALGIGLTSLAVGAIVWGLTAILRPKRKNKKPQNQRPAQRRPAAQTGRK